MREKSPDGRFQIVEILGGSDHFMGGDRTWHLIDTRTGNRVAAFGGDSYDSGSTHSVEFSEDGRELISRDAGGDVVGRFFLAITLPHDLYGITINLDTDFSALVKGVILENQPAPDATDASSGESRLDP